MNDVEAPPLADLQDAVLDDETVTRLFDDLARETVVSAVLVKGGPESHARGNGEIGLDEARRAFVTGAVIAMQIRYTWKGSAWCDTLMRGQGGVRLVRVALP